MNTSLPLPDELVPYPDAVVPDDFVPDIFHPKQGGGGGGGGGGGPQQGWTQGQANLLQGITNLFAYDQLGNQQHKLVDANGNTIQAAKFAVTINGDKTVSIAFATQGQYGSGTQNIHLPFRDPNDNSPWNFTVNGCACAVNNETGTASWDNGQGTATSSVNANGDYTCNLSYPNGKNATFTIPGAVSGIVGPNQDDFHMIMFVLGIAMSFFGAALAFWFLAIGGIIFLAGLILMLISAYFLSV